MCGTVVGVEHSDLPPRADVEPVAQVVHGLECECVQHQKRQRKIVHLHAEEPYNHTTPLKGPQDRQHWLTRLLLTNPPVPTGTCEDRLKLALTQKPRSASAMFVWNSSWTSHSNLQVAELAMRRCISTLL